MRIFGLGDHQSIILEAQDYTQGAWNPMHFNDYARNTAHGSLCTNATRYVLA